MGTGCGEWVDYDASLLKGLLLVPLCSDAVNPPDFVRVTRMFVFLGGWYWGGREGGGWRGFVDAWFMWIIPGWVWGRLMIIKFSGFCCQTPCGEGFG